MGSLLGELLKRLFLLDKHREEVVKKEKLPGTWKVSLIVIKKKDSKNQSKSNKLQDSLITYKLCCSGRVCKS